VSGPGSEEDGAPDEAAGEAPRVYDLRFTRRARPEIDPAPVRFAELPGEVVADEWQEGLLAAIGRLATLPRRQVVAPENRLFRQEVRQLVYRRRLALPPTVSCSPP
jgi:hypothetical protein